MVNVDSEVQCLPTGMSVHCSFMHKDVSLTFLVANLLTTRVSGHWYRKLLLDVCVGEGAYMTAWLKGSHRAFMECHWSI